MGLWESVLSEFLTYTTRSASMKWLECVTHIKINNKQNGADAKQVTIFRIY